MIWDWYRISHSLPSSFRLSNLRSCTVTATGRMISLYNTPTRFSSTLVFLCFFAFHHEFAIFAASNILLQYLRKWAGLHFPEKYLLDSTWVPRAAPMPLMTLQLIILSSLAGYLLINQAAELKETRTANTDENISKTMRSSNACSNTWLLAGGLCSLIVRDFFGGAGSSVQ